MGMRIHVLSRRPVGEVESVYCVPGTGDPEGILPHRVFLKGQELEFLSGLDFLILAMPLTPASEGIVGERELRGLPSSAFVLNPSRGPPRRATAHQSERARRRLVGPVDVLPPTSDKLDADSCGYTGSVALDRDTFLMVHSWFQKPDAKGRTSKAVPARRIRLTASTPAPQSR
jgi:hypothetical protein